MQQHPRCEGYRNKPKNYVVIKNTPYVHWPTCIHNRTQAQELEPDRRINMNPRPRAGQHSQKFALVRSFFSRWCPTRTPTRLRLLGWLFSVPGSVVQDWTSHRHLFYPHRIYRFSKAKLRCCYWSRRTGTLTNSFERNVNSLIWNWPKNVAQIYNYWSS